MVHRWSTGSTLVGPQVGHHLFVCWANVGPPVTILRWATSGLFVRWANVGPPLSLEYCYHAINHWRPTSVLPPVGQCWFTEGLQTICQAFTRSVIEEKRYRLSPNITDHLKEVLTCSFTVKYVCQCSIVYLYDIRNSQIYNGQTS